MEESANILEEEVAPFPKFGRNLRTPTNVNVSLEEAEQDRQEQFSPVGFAACEAVREEQGL